jgi:dihydrolipoamide dehydrogenase
MSDIQKFDLAVIGSGPGGYVAAIRAAQLGRSVALIEKGPLGGTCLNVGCIPTKTLLSNAALLAKIRHASDYGITTGPISIQYSQMKARKDQVVSKIGASLQGLIQSNQIAILRGTAAFTAPHELKIIGPNGGYIRAEKIIIATGSVPLDVPAFPCDHKKILNSTSILELTELPKSLIIIGGGYIGCEFASLFAELGTQVTVLEALPSILSLQGSQISQFMTRALKERGVTIRTGVKVASISSQPQVTLEGGETLSAEYALVAIGRKVYTDGLCLEKAGLLPNERGFIPVNQHMETAVPGLYAIGDVTGIAMLAHVASHQGIVAAEHASSHPAKIDYKAIPAVIFTHPEIATVGLTLEQAGEQATSGTFPFQALGKAQASLETGGFATLVIDKKTKQILGAQVVGHEASNLIGEMALAIQNELTLECLLETIHPHPTFGEIWLEAAFAARGAAIHLPPKAKR